jgi:hypothetical protein
MLRSVLRIVVAFAAMDLAIFPVKLDGHWDDTPPNRGWPQITSLLMNPYERPECELWQDPRPLPEPTAADAA